ncbi:MAG TPA: hypothetical protein VFS43_16235 [Polyangiaceae bacterium]|nr:hypothetical protein [Polyangiaceae bacterium]
MDFARTQLGYRFFEHTLPALVRELARLADAVGRLADAVSRLGGALRDVADGPEPPTERQPSTPGGGP